MHLNTLRAVAMQLKPLPKHVRVEVQRYGGDSSELRLLYLRDGKKYAAVMNVPDDRENIDGLIQEAEALLELMKDAIIAGKPCA